MVKLPFLERFPSRDGGVWNVHDATRLGWRRRLLEDQPAWFRALSARAAVFFQQAAGPAGRIEWAYHFLSADAERAADALRELSRAWSVMARPEDCQALALTLDELEATQAAFGEYLAISRRLAEQDSTNADWQRDLAVALSTMGDVLQAQDKPSNAEAAFKETVAIIWHLAKQDPSDARWQRLLARVHSMKKLLSVSGSFLERLRKP